MDWKVALGLTFAFVGLILSIGSLLYHKKKGNLEKYSFKSVNPKFRPFVIFMVWVVPGILVAGFMGLFVYGG